jgi:hypothetical protein
MPCKRLVGALKDLVCCNGCQQHLESKAIGSCVQPRGDEYEMDMT